MDTLNGIDTEKLAKAVDNLPEDEKVVVSLLWYEGMELDEVAQAVGRSPEETGAMQQGAMANISAALRGAGSPSDLAAWTRVEVDAECAEPWRSYDNELAERYTRYYERYPELRGEQRYSARDLAAALPPDWAGLADLVATDEWHRHHLSGKSSQTLAVGLLGVSARLDPSLSWLWDALAPLPPAEGSAPRIGFEQKLAADVLDERPRQTAIDVLVDDPSALICLEVKWREQGLGGCSCGPDGGNPIEGRCATRVEERERYWRAAADLFGLPAREPPGPCPISPAYQGVRNAAAARALAKPGKVAVFGLIYDERNPYFAGSGAWPGWPTVLGQAIDANADPQQFRFAAVSWQELLPLLELDEETKDWAREKHDL